MPQLKHFVIAPSKLLFKSVLISRIIWGEIKTFFSLLWQKNVNTLFVFQFFNQALILGKGDTKLAISRKVYDLIYELNLISPRILLAVLPQLEFKLKSTEESERMGSVSLLARMFSEKGSDLARKHKQLWNAFLGR